MVSEKGKHTGICPLCQMEKDLVQSHAIPAAVSKSLLRAAHGVHPFSVSAYRIVTTSRQYQDHVFCQPCEDLFNRNGEDWVMRQMWRPKGFRLLETLRDEVPVEEAPDGFVFATAGINDVEPAKLAYFAATMFWRMCVHAWAGPDGVRRRLDLGSYDEPMRRFLLGAEPFPENVAVTVFIWPDKDRILTATYLPRLDEHRPHHIYSYYLPGITFILHAGRQISTETRRLCCYRGAGNPVLTSVAAVAKTIRFLRLLSKNASGGDEEHRRQWMALEDQSDCEWFKVLRDRFRTSRAVRARS